MNDTDLIFTEAISCELVDALASDMDVVQAARISFNREDDVKSTSLIDYLLKNRHGSPFEHGIFRFRVEAPIFTFREHHRHRIGHSYNEMSGRYTELEPKFYIPRTARVQEGRPGHYIYVEQDEYHEMSKMMRAVLRHSYSNAWVDYQTLLEEGIAKEQARMVLPVGIFTKMIWTCNPRSLMHFLGLRNAKTAQAEIRMVAEQAEAALKEHMPVTYESFITNGRAAP